MKRVIFVCASVKSMFRVEGVNSKGMQPQCCMVEAGI
jgi:hypothetical protein